MKNILVGISNYRNHQLDFMCEVIEEYLSFESFNVDIEIFSTVKLNKYDDYENINQYLYDEDIGKKLSHEPRIKSLFTKYPSYDVIIYNENDTILTENTIKNWYEHNKLLPSDYVCGLLRYEILNDNRLLIDMHKDDGQQAHGLVNEVYEIGDHNYFSVDNVHQGGWVLSNKQIYKLVMENNIKFGDSLECACSNVYYSNKWPGSFGGLKKVIPTDFENFTVHHLPNKYVGMDDNWTSFEELMEILK
jgi:hypothetical protein